MNTQAIVRQTIESTPRRTGDIGADIFDMLAAVRVATGLEAEAELDGNRVEAVYLIETRAVTGSDWDAFQAEERLREEHPDAEVTAHAGPDCRIYEIRIEHRITLAA